MPPNHQTTTTLARANTKVRGRFLCKTMWPLTSQRVGAHENFQSSTKRDFFNNIPHPWTLVSSAAHVGRSANRRHHLN